MTGVVGSLTALDWGRDMRRLTDAFRRWRQRRREKIIKDATEKRDIGEPHMHQKYQ